MQNQKQNAIDFIKRQLGKRFQNNWTNKNYNPEDVENDTYANEWYCSELLWAAYYNCDNPFPEKKCLTSRCAKGQALQVKHPCLQDNYLLLNQLLSVHPEQQRDNH